ncbi:MAG: biotin/lipoyl-binding protein [Sphingobacteriaceae bacterium]|nr:biotin/lipoyl-binding protein [Sphingobacteriaceae bacterium]
MIMPLTNKNKMQITNWSKTMLIALTVLLASCGSKDPEDLAGLKAKQAELKTQLAEIASKINLLEGDSGKKFVLVEAAPLVPEIFKTYINVQGRVDAEENVSLASEIPGTITKINVKAGDEVSKGQILAETDARHSTNHFRFQTNTELVNQLYEKQKALWDQKIGTEVQILQAKTQKESMDKKMNTLQEQLRMTKIISPIDGTVDAVDIKLGQLLHRACRQFALSISITLKIKADFAESYASKVHKGDEVMIKFPDSNDTLTSKISYS